MVKKIQLNNYFYLPVGISLGYTEEKKEVRRERKRGKKRYKQQSQVNIRHFPSHAIFHQTSPRASQIG